MSGKNKWVGKATRAAALAGRVAVIARAGRPWMRVQVIDGCVTWTKLLPPDPKPIQIIIDDIWDEPAS